MRSDPLGGGRSGGPEEEPAEAPERGGIDEERRPAPPAPRPDRGEPGAVVQLGGLRRELVLDPAVEAEGAQRVPLRDGREHDEAGTLRALREEREVDARRDVRGPRSV